MSYIEKDRPGEYFNPASSTVVINPTGDCPVDTKDKATSEYEENLARWNWLITGWDTMTFKEKMGLFVPYLHYVNVRDNKKPEFDDRINTEKIEMMYKLCRTYRDCKFDPDGQGVPNLIMEFDPIDTEMIPDAEVQASVIRWGRKYGFLYDPYSAYETASSNSIC